MSSQNTALIFSSVVWNFYRTRPHEIAFALRKRGHRIFYVEPIRYAGATSTRFSSLVEHPKKGIDVVVRNTRLRKGILLLLYENVRNMFLVLRVRPQVVISGDVWMSAGIVVLCRLMRTRFVFDHMDYWPAVEKSRFLQIIIRRAIYPLLGRLSSAVINTSHFLQKEMARYTARSLYLPNAKSFEEIMHNDARRQKKSIRTFYHRVVFIATLRDWYDYHLLIEVFAQLPQIRLDIYGNGPLKQTIVDEARPYANITVHDQIPSSQIGSEITRSDFGVLPLRNIFVNQGVMPIKLLDYWAASVPVIATPMGELQLLAHEGKGMCLAQESAEWIACIERWYREPETLFIEGEAGHRRMMTEFNYDILIPELSIM